MNKRAYLVTVSITTRIVTDDLDDEIIEPKIRKNLIARIDNGEVMENIESFIEDKECPYNPETDD